MEEKGLKFLDTYTVEQFKRAMGVEKISVKPMPKRDAKGQVLRDSNNQVIYHDKSDNMMFFTFGAKTGAVSRKGIPVHPMISLVQGNDGEKFFLLHEEGNGGAPEIASF